MPTAVDVFRQTAKKEARIILNELMPRYQSLRKKVIAIRNEIRDDHKSLVEIQKRLKALEEIVGCVHPVAVKRPKGPKYRVNSDTMKKIRERGELSQNELAVMLDVSLTSVNRWECEKRELSPKVIKKIVFLRGMSRRQLRNYLSEKTFESSGRNE